MSNPRHEKFPWLGATVMIVMICAILYYLLLV